MQKSISKIMSLAYDKVNEYLSNEFQHLKFYISPTGELSCWVKAGANSCGAAIVMEHTINVGQILFHHWRYLQELNKRVEPAHTQPSEYFYCSECGEVKPNSEYADFVMAANFCKVCAKKKPIANLIKESKKRGFYD